MFGLDSPKLGIGIATYNRSPRLGKTLEALRANTSTEHTLVVGDDGSIDNTREMLRHLGIPCVTGHNYGVAWNKNRILFFLAVVHKCNPVLLLEDDCEQTVYGWERDWIRGTNLWGHLHFNVADIALGKGTPEDPWRARAMGAQCCGYSREALSMVGFFDTRFRGYGHEHVEYSLRMLRAGYGGIYAIEGGAQFYAIQSSLKVHEEPSSASFENILSNATVARDIIREPLFRWAWRTDDEMSEFRAEQAKAVGVSSRAHLRPT